METEIEQLNGQVSRLQDEIVQQDEEIGELREGKVRLRKQLTDLDVIPES